jgi:hypothetical protein
MLGEVLNAEEKAMQLTIDALKDAAAWPGPDQRTLVVLGNAMNARSPYPDVEVPDTSPPEFVPDRADVRGAAVPLMGPADHASASPLMGPAAPATVTPLLGPADHGTMVPLMGPADPGTATPLMLPSR